MIKVLKNWNWLLSTIKKKKRLGAWDILPVAQIQKRSVLILFYFFFFFWDYEKFKENEGGLIATTKLRKKSLNSISEPLSIKWLSGLRKLSVLKEVWRAGRRARRVRNTYLCSEKEGAERFACSKMYIKKSWSQQQTRRQIIQQTVPIITYHQHLKYNR